MCVSPSPAAKNTFLGLGLSVSEMEVLLLKVLGALRRLSIVFNFVFSKYARV